jgi:hypothetical protein
VEVEDKVLDASPNMHWQLKALVVHKQAYEHSPLGIHNGSHKNQLSENKRKHKLKPWLWQHRQ